MLENFRPKILETEQKTEGTPNFSKAFIEFEKEMVSLHDYVLEISQIKPEELKAKKLKDRIKSCVGLIFTLLDAFKELASHFGEVSEQEIIWAKRDLLVLHNLIEKFYNNVSLKLGSLLETSKQEISDEDFFGESLRELKDDLEKLFLIVN